MSAISSSQIVRATDTVMTTLRMRPAGLDWSSLSWTLVKRGFLSTDRRAAVSSVFSKINVSPLRSLCTMLASDGSRRASLSSM